jgi:hypothetical protein
LKITVIIIIDIPVIIVKIMRIICFSFSGIRSTGFLRVHKCQFSGVSASYQRSNESEIFFRDRSFEYSIWKKLFEYAVLLFISSTLILEYYLLPSPFFLYTHSQLLVS